MKLTFTILLRTLLARDFVATYRNPGHNQPITTSVNGCLFCCLAEDSIGLWLALIRKVLVICLSSTQQGSCASFAWML
jgi:hypothetical protein